MKNENTMNKNNEVCKTIESYESAVAEKNVKITSGNSYLSAIPGHHKTSGKILTS